MCSKWLLCKAVCFQLALWRSTRNDEVLTVAAGVPQALCLKRGAARERSLCCVSWP